MTDYKNPKLIVESGKVKEDRVGWRSPSNIALIKYWGKHGQQLPRNPSISFTLQEAYSETTISYRPKTGPIQGVDLTFLFNGRPQPGFEEKIKKYFGTLTEIFPFIQQLTFRIESSNSFPHSAGIASSASGMSALALCLCSIEQKLFGNLEKENEFLQKASYLARLGSGSACRSVYGGMALWGKTNEIEQSSDLYAVPFFDELHSVFKTFHDSIYIVSKSEKAVSSRAGHQLMDNNIYAENRYTQARQHLRRLLLALREGDLEIAGNIIESEALILHALMMTSTPSFILMQPNTLEMITRIRRFRKETGHPVYFTLDAGPNIHLLYPDAVKEPVNVFAEEQLLPLCQDKQWIKDRVGEGPKEIK